MRLHETKFALGASYEVAFAPDESALFVAGARPRRWDLSTGRRTDTMWTHGNGLDVSPDGTRLVMTNTGGDVVMVDAATLDQLWVADGRVFGEGTAPRFTADGSAFVTCTWVGDTVVRSADTGAIVLHERFEGRMITRLACSPDRLWFAQTGMGASVYVRRWPFTEHAARELHADDSVDAAALDDAGRLALLTHSGVLVVNVETGERIGAHAAQQLGGNALAWSPDGELVAVLSGRVLALDGDTLEERWSLPLPYASAAAYSPSGALLALGAWEQGVVLSRHGPGTSVRYDDPPTEEDDAPDSIQGATDEEQWVIEYVESEGGEGVRSIEHVSSHRVGATRYDVWDVQGESVRWWAISPPLAAYDQGEHPHADTALSFHVGSAARMDENHFGPAWTHWERAADVLADARSPADVAPVLDALLAALGAVELEDPLATFARGLSDYVAALAATDAPAHRECELAVLSVHRLLDVADA